MKLKKIIFGIKIVKFLINYQTKSQAMKSAVILFLCFLITPNVHSQANDAEALLYNVSIGGIFGTIGSFINKKPQEKIGQVVLKGFSQGSFGGLITFGSKSLLRETQRQEDWKYIWGAKILNAAGTSIKENAAMNRDFWEYWHINIGFNRIEFETKNKFKLHYKLMPIAFVYTVRAFTKVNFDINYSLKTGEFIFYSRSQFINTVAVTLPGVIIYDKNIYENISTKAVDRYKILTHEIIHIYQSNDYSIFNTYYQKSINRFAEKNKTINFLNNNVYIDLHYIPLRASYLLENKNTNYYDNFFEHEAGYFSNTLR